MRHVNANLGSTRKALLICAQSGRFSGLVKKTDSASSTRSDKRGLNGNSSRLLGIVNKFCIPFGTKNKIVISGGARQCYTVVTLHRTANFRVKHLNSDIEQTRRGIVLLVLLPILIPTAYINTPISFFSEKHSTRSGF